MSDELAAKTDELSKLRQSSTEIACKLKSELAEKSEEAAFLNVSSVCVKGGFIGELGGSTPLASASTPQRNLQPPRKKTPPEMSLLAKRRYYFSKIVACGGLLFQPYYENVFFY